MSAWYVLNALGLYPLSPASGDYVIGSPQFGNVTIKIGGESGTTTATGATGSGGSGGGSIVISASNQGTDNVYVQSVSWNGVDIQGVYISYEDLMLGGVLHFEMGDTPAAAAASS
jgi:putative alpha-1,2-mannosidase